MLLEPGEQRREPGDGMRVTVCAQLRKRGVKRAAEVVPFAVELRGGGPVISELRRA
ncbi:MAG: hypothetical protein ACRDK0_11405 [Solirubrobacteraceae bacterium]